jgi:hypothetical protein
MRKFVVLLLGILFSTSIKAEYNGFHITISIENEKGKLSKGFVYVASGYLTQDSLNNSDYLKRALNQGWKDSDKQNRFTYFKERIEYEYTAVWDSSGTKNSIYYLTGKTHISCKAIKKITVEDMIDFGYAQAIANEIHASDTVWMKREPIRKVSFGGYLSFYQIFVHENSPKVNAIIEQLELKQKEIGNSELQEDYGNSDYQRGDKIDAELWAIIKKLNKQRVIIVATYSC